MTVPDVALLIADLSAQIADYDEDDVPFTGHALRREISDDDSKLFREVRGKLEEARSALQGAGAPAEAELEVLQRAHELLDVVEEYIRLQPFIVMKSIVENISEISVEPGSPGTAQAVASLEAMDIFDRREAEHLSSLMTTTDPLGIFLRGFVLIEGSLNRCFQKFLARPLSLHKELDLYVSGKIKLGHALGFLSDGEKSFLSALNAERNKLVHENESGKRMPRYAFTVTEERRLWGLFAALPSILGPWSAYDESLYPKNLKTMLTAVWLMLNGRGSDLQTRSLRPLDEDLRRNRLERQMIGAFAVLMVKAAPIIASELAAFDAK